MVNAWSVKNKPDWQTNQIIQQALVSRQIHSAGFDQQELMFVQIQIMDISRRFETLKSTLVG